MDYGMTLVYGTRFSTGFLPEILWLYQVFPTVGAGQVSCFDAEDLCVREVGIITAMRMEARCITSLRLPFNQKISLGENAAIWLCGMGEEAAREAAEGLKMGGARALMSFGFAGALDSNLRPGHLILPESVHAEPSLQVDLSWRDSLRQCLPGHLNVTGGVLAASSKMLTSAIAKRELAQATGACAVDMESGAVAEAAVPRACRFWRYGRSRTRLTFRRLQFCSMRCARTEARTSLASCLCWYGDL